VSKRIEIPGVKLGEEVQLLFNGPYDEECAKGIVVKKGFIGIGKEGQSQMEGPARERFATIFCAMKIRESGSRG